MSFVADVWKRRPARLPAAVLAVAIAAGPARADRASTALAKYDQPVNKSIDRALAYLAKHQQKDGAIHVNAQCITAITSLSVMAFLAKGYTPGTGPYGEVIDRGIDYVLASQQSNGLIVNPRNARGPMYSHCISTLLLSEVSGMVAPARQKRIDKALGRALLVVLAAQGVAKSAMHRGGWRYQHTSRDSDISCTGWAIMSLRSARNNGSPVPKEAVDDGIRFVMRCRSPNGGFCYQPGGSPGTARTGTALLCLELCGQHRSAAALKAGDSILESIGAARAGAAQQQAQWEQKAQLQAQKIIDAAERRVELAKRRGEAGNRALELARRQVELARRRAEQVKGRMQLARQRATMRFGGSHFYYGLYYCSQGMFQLGGDYWERFAAYMYEMMLKFQRDDGSWPAKGGGTGPCYSTAMGVLAMSVSYRQLPIYQR